MKKFLKVFNTEEEYLEYTASTEFNLNSVSRCREGRLVFFNPADCGGQGMHRTVTGETYCDGYDKRVYLYKQVSYDGGTTWETTATTSSLVEKDSEDCGYVPPTPPPTEYDITAKYNATDTSSPTKILSTISNISKIEIDGVEQNVTTSYTFDTIGEHTVKYKLIDKTSISASSFSTCTRLTSIDILDSVTSIGNSAFINCYNLTSIDIPSGVTSIGDNAFNTCAQITSVTVNAQTPPTLGNNAFTNTNDCPIYVPCDSVDAYKAATNWSTYASRIQGYCWDITAKFNATNTSSPTRIIYEGYAGEICTSGFSAVEIDGVVQPSVTTGYTFSTTGEHTVRYRLTGTSIVNRSFTNCSGMTNVTVRDRVTDIGYYAFYGCSSLTSATIPDSVTSIREGIFQYCTSVTDVGPNSSSASVKIPNCMLELLPSSVASTFYGCSGLTSVTIDDSVTSIGISVFGSCTSLTSITIPDSVTSIGRGAFYECSSLTSITIPNSVTNIGSNSFSYCKNLRNVVISDSVTSIGEGAFQQCSGLASITVESGNSVYDSRNNCNAIIETNTNTLLVGCKNTVIPNTITSIGTYAFESCGRLTSITIPDNVTSIGDSAFVYCSGLTSVNIGSGVTSISTLAFAGCRSLTSITCNATTAPTIQDNTFNSVKKGGTLYVPEGSNYNTWMSTSNYYLGKYNWTKVEQ